MAALDFNPRAPRGARRGGLTLNDTKQTFQSTRPAWGATVHEYARAYSLDISIHAPRMGRD